MAGAVPREALAALMGKVLRSLESEQIRTLRNTRKALGWKMRDVHGSLDALSDDGKEALYCALVKVCTDLDNLREGTSGEPKWTEALTSFFYSRNALETFDVEIKRIDDIVAGTRNSKKKVASKKCYAVSDFESDLQSDFRRTLKAVQKTLFDDMMTQEVKSVLRSTKSFFARAEALEKTEDLIKVLSEPFGEFAKLQMQVEKIASRATPAPINPAIEVTSPQVFTLNLSLDYGPLSDGAFEFEKNKDGSFEKLQCFVFVPDLATHVLKTWFKHKQKKRISFPWKNNRTFQLKFTVDNKMCWTEENVTKLEGSKTFQHKGHTFTIKYRTTEDGRRTWSTTIVDGNSYPKTLSHQQWAEVRALHSHKTRSP
mmetsp:Transcript_11337/g.20968  ORF Transcript_11337/g.20968 Transcript_11337/m.20968 type:complete len:370 (+) Transcript_11337:123-1232(+)